MNQCLYMDKNNIAENKKWLGGGGGGGGGDDNYTTTRWLHRSQ